MDDIVFNSVQELYERLKPALASKKNEMSLLGYKDIKEIDIWNYLKVKKWANAHNLLLYQMVDDIINAPALVLIDYYKKDSE